MASTETKRTTTVKTTEGEAPAMTYRPSVNARTVVIQRSSYGGTSSGTSSSSRERSTSYGGASIPAGAYAAVSSSGVTAVKSSREQEKKDMQDLNERFASYIEKVIAACDMFHITLMLALLLYAANRPANEVCRHSNTKMPAVYMHSVLIATSRHRNTSSVLPDE